MTKKVLFYARNTTHRQSPASIETQTELGEAFVKSREWKLVAIYADTAVSGTGHLVRPGIQSLMAHAKRERIDIVLCTTLDRLSRDPEHRAEILKELRDHHADIWTVDAGLPVSQLEMIGSKHKAPASIAVYGYKISQQRDGTDNRFEGSRTIDPVQAEIVCRIYQLYAGGLSSQDIAERLNDQNVPGPRGRKWREATIRGHAGRGTGILNNEVYIGRSRLSSEEDEHLASRIVSDDLWTRVKLRQGSASRDPAGSR